MSSNKNEQSEINIEQLETVLSHVVNTNNQLQSKNIVPVAMNVIGDAGLGKTSTIRQVGASMGYKKENIVLLNLSTFEEIGDLIGIPVMEFKMIKEVGATPDGKKKYSGTWVKEMAISNYQSKGFEVTNQTRMAYAAPEWIAGVTGPGILILDDYTRASQRFTQAVMQLIEEQSYATWSLPKGWTILLSSNPDDGMYNVTDQDPAQQSRYMNVNLKFDANVWAKWAEKSGIDSRCINFVLMNKEIMSTQGKHVNARSMTKFFNIISSIADFNTNEGLEMIQLLGEGSLGSDVTTTFTAFIHNKMDKLITTEELIDSATPWKKIETELEKLINGNGTYRGDIAFVITTRLMNHITFNMKDDEFTDDLKNRMEEVITSPVLGGDLKFVLGRKLINMEGGKFTQLLFNDYVVDNILE
jgi:hypothetical protein